MGRGTLIGPVIVAIGVVVAAIAFAVVTVLIDTADGGTDLRLQRLEETVARLEAILLDPVYTGKAMSGLIHLARRGHWSPEAHVVFLHTGGQAGLFAYADHIRADTPDGL